MLILIRAATLPGNEAPWHFIAMPQSFCQKQQRHQSEASLFLPNTHHSQQITLQPDNFYLSKASTNKCCPLDKIFSYATEVSRYGNVFPCNANCNNSHSNLSKFTNRRRNFFSNINFLWIQKLTPEFGSHPNPLIPCTSFVGSYENQSHKVQGKRRSCR